MKLSALAATSGVSTASIKYYIHVGILPPGRKRNATTAVYDQSHLERLELITCLRRDLDSPIDSIAELTRAIADETLANIELMGICQRLALEASNVGPPDATSANDQASDFENDIRSVLRERGWPDISPTAVAAMAHVLDQLREVGYDVGRDTIALHIRALTEIAQANTEVITDNLSRDAICVAVVRGITLHNRLLLASSALAHASLAAKSRMPQAPPATTAST